MTAYELADKLQELDSRLHLIDLFKSADMLRQQADRIAELEKEIDKNFKDGFEAGKLEGWKAHKYHSTPQTKLLSDEEIIAIRDSCYVQSGIDEWEFDDVNFARAILRKASEK